VTPREHLVEIVQYTESTFYAISLRWRGRDPSRSGGWIMLIRAPGAAVVRRYGSSCARTILVVGPFLRQKGKRTGTAFVATGDGHISPLTVSSVVESRTTSPWLTNGIKHKASPFALNGVPAPAVPTAFPPRRSIFFGKITLSILVLRFME
jgi:hypothetical protein